ncbi:MAG TPA: hypothetical protein VHV10_15765 [Ktedonobacteraceae bacterium]|jgi:hypothetical protein|nr:hypothetical protein [Ktedonobacteraceae bacterium]
MPKGNSGYAVSPDNVIEMASAVERTDTIDRSACADYAREQFSLKKTAKDYFDLMQRIC